MKAERLQRYDDHGCVLEYISLDEAKKLETKIDRLEIELVTVANVIQAGTMIMKSDAKEIKRLQGDVSILSDVCRHFMFEVVELQAKRLTSFKTVVVEAERVLAAVKEKQ